MQEHRLLSCMCWAETPVFYISACPWLKPFRTDKIAFKAKLALDQSFQGKFHTRLWYCTRVDMKPAILFLASLFTSATAYNGAMTYYETGKSITHPSIAPSHPSFTHTLTHSFSPRPRLLRLHLSRLRRHRRPLRPNDEQPRQPKRQPPLRHQDQHLQPSHLYHDAGYHC